MGAQFVVGIDLGTTHTVVAFSELVARATPLRPKIFNVPQYTSARAIEARPLLPSALYAPLKSEILGDPDWIVGEFAAKRGAEVAGRFVASAKSWLSYSAVDRLAAILPWGTEQGAPRMSPVEASARILAHVRDAWDAAHPMAKLAGQDVVLTLPASFDEVARVLTLRAAESVGICPTLLEEPTAAFYDALEDKRAVLKLARHGECTVLVCDVGGGTTDLSLMVIAPSSGDDDDGFTVRRIAVGRHILLGGDNMDLALAHLAESRMAPPPSRLDSADLAALVASCRAAKERIFSGHANANEATVTVLGRGGKLVGGARTTTLTRSEVSELVLAGFFPKITGTEAPSRGRGGIVAFGLPYERDPAITRHVHQFLSRHAASLAHGARGGVPDALLLNGGVFHAAPIASALVEAMAAWGGGKAPNVIANRDPDLAVARGAVRYGLARRGLVYRVESGASHGYYVEIAPDEGSKQMRAVCIIPRGAKPGVHHEAGRRFELVVGRSVRFDMVASDVAQDEAGALVTIDDDSFERLPAVVANIPRVGRESVVPVHLGGELLPTGQLALECTEIIEENQAVLAQPRSHRLEFQLRERGCVPSTPAGAPPPSIAPQSAKAAGAASPARALADAIIDRVFGRKGEADAREAKDIVRDLEKVLGDRGSWTMQTARELGDRLLDNTGARRRSAHHERNYWLLLGFCMRPGFGDPGDLDRVQRAWPMFESRLAFPGEPRGWQQFFIAWRRMAGGMTEPMQVAFRDAMDAVIAPAEAGLKKPKRMPDAPDELLATLASFERVPVARRVALGEWVVERTWASGDARLWSSLGRIGARVPLYASVHHVVPPSMAEAWLDRILRLKWESISTAPHAAVQLARVTGDRARDVSDKHRNEVEKKLMAIGAKPAWIQAVRELVSVGDEERVAILGEGLPIGLRLSSSP
ncbi:MAG: hsp70 family protein [Polyangiaceae bacterium]|nr:hsp70 family protein [Polyangiaceae bacterium]